MNRLACGVANLPKHRRMRHFLVHAGMLLLLFSFPTATWAQEAAKAESPESVAEAPQKELVLTREQLMASFQKLRIVPQGGMYLFAQGKFPELEWEQPLVVREVWGRVLPLNVRWFDGEGKEVASASQPGRYAAYVEAQVPGGVTIRRAYTFYAFDLAKLTKAFREQQQDVTPADAPLAILGANGPAVLRETYQELAQDAVNQHLFRSEKGAILLSSAEELQDTQRQTGPMDHPMIRHQEHHLAIRRRLLGIEDKYPPLERPRSRGADLAPVLREGLPAEAGLADELPTKLQALCDRWLAEGGEPFTLVVARSGVVVFHQAMGRHQGKDVTRDNAFPMYSLTKSMTGMMLAQFLDQGLLELDTPLGEVLTDFPLEGEYVPTLRDCLMHVSGIEGQIAFDGLDNPWMDNVIANGWETHRQHYHYSGTACDLAGFAMATVAGKSVPRLFHEHLFGPLGMVNARVTSLGMGGHLRAIDLARLGQMMLNRGSYGEHMFFSPDTYELMLPEPYEKRYAHLEVKDQAYGLGIRYAAERHPGAGQNGLPTDATIFSPGTLGHGSFSGSILRIDPEHQVIVAMGRHASGEKHGQFAQELFVTVMDAVR